MSLADSPISATIPAKDIDRAKAWYKDKLGLTPVLDLGPAGQVYRTGSTNFTLYQTAFAGTGKHTLGGWAVPDLAREMTELRSRGVKFEEYSGGQGPTTENGIARDAGGGAAAWFTDSEGNVLSLIELPPGMDINNPAG